MISMTVKPNDSPLYGKDGDKFTYLQLKERFQRESENDVSLRVEFDPKSKENIFVFGRGDLHLGILIEKMRREGFEMCLTPPLVIFKEEKGEKLEPIEEVSIELGSEYLSVLMDAVSNRKGLIQHTDDIDATRIKVTFEAPSRGLFGFRPFMIALTKGHCVILR
jgi:GTP-binding protein